MGFACSAISMSKLYSNALMASLNSRAPRFRSSSSLDYDSEPGGTAQHFTTVQLGPTSVENHTTQDDSESVNGMAVPDVKLERLAFPL
jgi:hypothetical protein